MASYSWVYEDPFHSVYLTSTTLLSFLSNGLLLVIIFKTKSAAIGSYRYLLALFAACDIFTGIAHYTLHGIMHMTRDGYYFFPQRDPIMIGGHSFDTVACLIFVSAFFQTFLILAYHFVYRYKAITSSICHCFTDNWPISAWITLAASVNVLFISTILVIYSIVFASDDDMREIIAQTVSDYYGVNLRDPNRGFIVIALRRIDPESGESVWHAPSVVGMIISLGIFIATASVIVWCICSIKSVFRVSHIRISAKTKQMHVHLFHALLIQTAVPLLCSYLPSSIILIFPAVTAISLGAFGNILYLPTAIFPAIDALFILYFINGFRLAVIQLFRLPFRTAVGPPTQHSLCFTIST